MLPQNQREIEIKIRRAMANMWSIRTSLRALCVSVLPILYPLIVKSWKLNLLDFWSNNLFITSSNNRTKSPNNPNSTCSSKLPPSLDPLSVQ